MKNLILLSLLICVVCFPNISNAQDCFSSDFNFASSITENLCSGEIPNLPVQGINYNLTGDTNTQVGGLSWFTGIDPDVDAIFSPTSVTQPGCDPGPLTTVYAFAQCDDGANLLWIQVASHSFQAYPEPQMPFLNGPDIDAFNGDCHYTIVPVCPDDILSTTDFVIPPGAPGGTLSLYVENPNGVCEGSEFIIDYNACPGPTDFGSLNLSIWLEGVNETTAGSMESNLADLQILPNTQPFNQAPWSYNGTETLPPSISEMVDWVLIELRTGTPNLINPNTEIAFRQAALLLSDGTIVGANSSQELGFLGIVEGESYYVAVRHRNHLDVLSAAPVIFNAGIGPIAYDFTTNVGQAFGPDQLKEMPNGQFALYAGDFNGDGVIQVSDYDLWKVEPAVVNVYQASDGNLDGVIQVTDYDIWFLNKAKVGVSELQD